MTSLYHLKRSGLKDSPKKFPKSLIIPGFTGNGVWIQKQVQLELINQQLIPSPPNCQSALRHDLKLHGDFRRKALAIQIVLDFTD